MTILRFEQSRPYRSDCRSREALRFLWCCQSTDSLVSFMQPQLQHLRKGSSPFASPASPSHPRTSAPAPSAYSHRSVSDLIMIQSHSLTPQEHTWHTRAHILMSTTNIERTFIWKAVLLPPCGDHSTERLKIHIEEKECVCVCVDAWVSLTARETHLPTFRAPFDPDLSCFFFFFLKH